MLTHGQMSTDYGKIVIDRNVIAAYAGSIAIEIAGVVGMAAVNVTDGIVRLLKKDHFAHGIEVDIDDENGLYLTFHVIVAYGTSLLSVMDNLTHSVEYKLETFTGMKVKDVKVMIEGIRVID